MDGPSQTASTTATLRLSALSDSWLRASVDDPLPLRYSLSKEKLTARAHIGAVGTFLLTHLVSFVFLAFPLGAGCPAGQINGWVELLGHFIYGIAVAVAGWMVAARAVLGTPLRLLVAGPVFASTVMLAVQLLAARYGPPVRPSVWRYHGLVIVVGTTVLVTSLGLLLQRRPQQHKEPQPAATAAAPTVQIDPSELLMAGSSGEPRVSAAAVAPRRGRAAQAVLLWLFVLVMLAYYTALQQITLGAIFLEPLGAGGYLGFVTLGWAARLVARALAVGLDAGRPAAPGGGGGGGGGCGSLYFMTELMVSGWYYSFYRLLFSHEARPAVFAACQAAHLASEWTWALRATDAYYRGVGRAAALLPRAAAAALEYVLLPSHPRVGRDDWACFCCLDYGIVAAMQVHTAVVWLWSSSFVRDGYNAPYFLYCGGIGDAQFATLRGYVLAALLSELANSAAMHALFWRHRRLSAAAQLVRYMQQPLVRCWCVVAVGIVSINTFHAVTTGAQCRGPFHHQSSGG